MPFFESIERLTSRTDLEASSELIQRRRYGVIEAVDGQLVAVRFRPWRKWISLPELLFFGNRYHDRHRADRCRLYFHQPRRFPNFLAVPYLLCGRGTGLATIHAALAALDEIARIKQTDALLADIFNFRLSPRLLSRYGWVPHKPSRWHRHYIKRFYGEYPKRGETRETASELRHQTAS